MIVVLNSLDNSSNGQQMHYPGGIKSPAYWFAAEQTNKASGFRSKINGDSLLIPYNNIGQLNYNPSLLFNGNSNLLVPIDKRKLSAVSYFTIYKSSDTSHESVIWHTLNDNKTDLVLTTSRMANLASIQYMNYTDVIKGNAKINIYLQQPGKQNYQPLKHTMQVASKPSNPKLPVSSFKGSIPEIIIYNRVLSGQERLKVSSYLAIKYGITLTDPEAVYLNSSGKKTWEGTKYSLYHHNIAGIGRDDSSGLMQPVSESSNTPGLLTVFALDKLRDKNFLLWGDNGLSLQEDDKIAGLPAFIQKKWLFVPSLDSVALNTNIVIDTKQLDVPLPVNPVYWLAIDSSGSGDFPATATTFVRMSQLDQQGKAYFKDLNWSIHTSPKKVLGVVAAQDLLLFSEVTEPTCNAPDSGALSIKILGGLPPYQLSVAANGQPLYKKSIPDNKTPVLLTNLNAGNYSLHVTDASKIVYTDSFYVNYANAPKPYLIKSQYDLMPYEQLTLNAANQMQTGISYKWTGPDNFKSASPQISIRQPGIYTLSTSNKDGCSYKQEIKVNEVPGNVFKSVMIYPNPSPGRFNIQVNLYWITEVKMYIYTSDGRLIKSISMNGKSNYFFSEELRANGAYEIVFESNEAKVNKRIIINK